MALVLANRVQETATPNTTVSFTLTGAVSGFQTFAVIGNTNTTYYTATDTAGNWEVGLGQYSTTGPTLTRLTFYASSAGGGPVSFPGNVTVFVTYPSGSSVYLDFSGNVSPLGTIFSGNWQASTVGVAYGGTGVTTSSGPNSVVLRDANENITVNRINQGLQTVTATGGTTTLTAASDFNQALVGTGGHTFRLPDATTLSDTTTFQFNNNATGTLTIENNAGTAVGTVASGGAAGIALLSNATVGGTWDVHAYIPENVTWGTNALALGGTVISGGTWQGGTIQSGYGGTGLTTFTGANNALYSTSASALTAGTLPVVAGGTGLTSFTANGIPYANSTTTLTTGSALTFDGTNLGLGTASPSGASGTTFAINGGAGQTRLALKNNGSGDASSDGFQIALLADGVNVVYQNRESGYQSWELAGSEAMRLTSTTLSLVNNPTLSAGTANGVAYLNGSKVLTTGSALTFDGTNFRNTSGAFEGVDNMTLTALVSGTNSTVLTLNSAGTNGTTRFQINGSEKMRLTSTTLYTASGVDVGIGTSSPSTRLHVVSSSRNVATIESTDDGALNGPYLNLFRNSATPAASDYLGFLQFSGRSTTGVAVDYAWIGAQATQVTTSPAQNGDLIFTTATTGSLTEKMRLDSSGNLGLGVTPSAWSGVGGVFEVKGNSYIYSTTGVMSLGANAYFNGTNWIYKTTQAATRYEQVNGQHQWGIAPSGTAGNAISFTQAMTLDASGNLALTKIALNSDSPFYTGANISSGSNALGMGSTGAAQIGFFTNNTERARIDSSGNFLVGGTSSAFTSSGRGVVQINGSTESLLGFSQGGTASAYLYSAPSALLIVNAQNTPITFSTNSTERARIDSSGDLLVGTTSQPVSGVTARLAISQSAADYSSVLVSSQTTAANCYGARIQYTGAAPNGTGNPFLVMLDTGGDRAVFRSNGGLANYSANDVNLSDRREKTNFAPAKSYLDTICAIPVQTFNYIDQSEDDPGLTLGVVAQDVQAVAPELVMESNWGTKEDPKMRLSIYQTDLQYALMKCIQELKAEVDSLKAQLKGTQP